MRFGQISIGGGVGGLGLAITLTVAVAQFAVHGAS
jgi:hypothetical protein